MISYELAKKLKDAGFPQGRYERSYIDQDAWQVPTLSELIEACGYIEDKVPWFKSLVRHATKETDKQRPGVPYFGLPAEWSAKSRNSTRFKTGIKVWGSTAEEAMANLYLTINNKN